MDIIFLILGGRGYVCTFLGLFIWVLFFLDVSSEIFLVLG